MTLKVTSTSDRFVVESKSPEETLSVGRRIGEALGAGSCVALYGELGAGKTVFARGLVRGLGVAEEAAVTSPSFVIVSEYKGRLGVHHVDAYRLAGSSDIVDLGSRELFFGDEVSIVEWAERIEAALPEERIDVALSVEGETRRRIEMRARGEGAARVLGELKKALGVDV